MRIPNPIFAFSAAVALAILPACANDVIRSAAPLPSGSSLAPSAKRVASGVFAAMAQQANLYSVPDSTNNPPVCTLASDLSKGIAVDANGTLWVPNASGVIASYKKGSCKHGARTLSETTGIPDDIAFSAAGTAYVTVNGSSSSVLVFKKGSSTPSATLSDPSVTVMRGVAVDGFGNVFVSCVKERERSCVMEFAGGAMPGKFLDITVATSDGLEMDANHNLLVVDPGARRTEIFAPPYKGAPSAAFALRGSSEFGKLDATNSNFYASNFSSGTIDVFAYPSGTYEYSISNGLKVDGVWGIAVFPPSKH